MGGPTSASRVQSQRPNSNILQTCLETMLSKLWNPISNSNLKGQTQTEFEHLKGWNVCRVRTCNIIRTCAYTHARTDTHLRIHSCVHTLVSTVHLEVVHLKGLFKLPRRVPKAATTQGMLASANRRTWCIHTVKLFSFIIIFKVLASESVLNLKVVGHMSKSEATSVQT